MDTKYFIQDGRLKGWKREYIRGASMEIYGEKLSNSFAGLTFAEAAVYVHERRQDFGSGETLLGVGLVVRGLGRGRSPLTGRRIFENLQKIS